MRNPKKSFSLVSVAVLLALLSLPIASLIALPGDETKLGFLERPSVDQILDQLGYKNMTCTEGKKVEDDNGYTITANCAKGSDNYLVSLWVSLDWTKGHIISVTKR